MDVSWDPDSDAVVQQKINDVDTSSVEDQKVTAVIAAIDTSTEDQASGFEHSKRCRRTKKLLFTKKVRVLLDSVVISGFTEREPPNASPTLNGRW